MTNNKIVYLDEYKKQKILSRIEHYTDEERNYFWFLMREMLDEKKSVREVN